MIKGGNDLNTKEHQELNWKEILYGHLTAIVYFGVLLYVLYQSKLNYESIDKIIGITLFYIIGPLLIIQNTMLLIYKKSYNLLIYNAVSISSITLLRGGYQLEFSIFILFMAILGFWGTNKHQINNCMTNPSIAKQSLILPIVYTVIILLFKFT